VQNCNSKATSSRAFLRLKIATLLPPTVLTRGRRC